MRLCGGIDWSREGNSLRGLFVTVSELWLSLIGSIKTRGCIFKDKQNGKRWGEGERRRARRTNARQKEGRGGASDDRLARQCSGGANESSVGPDNGPTVPVPAVNLLPSGRGGRIGSGIIKPSSMESVWLSVCLPFPPNESLINGAYSARSTVWHQRLDDGWWMRRFIDTNKV